MTILEKLSYGSAPLYGFLRVKRKSMPQQASPASFGMLLGLLVVLVLSISETSIGWNWDRVLEGGGGGWAKLGVDFLGVPARREQISSIVSWVVRAFLQGLY